MRTMQELCKEVLDVQNASNLSGVVHAFSRAMTDLRTLLENEPGFNTETINQHPVSILYSDKITSLTHSDTAAFSKAYEFCCKEAGQ